MQTPKPYDRPQMIRVARATAMMGISRATLYRWEKRGLFTIIKRGCLSYVPTAEIEAYLDPNAENMVG